MQERATVRQPRRDHARRELTGDEALERIAALGWRGLEQEYLGGWLLRASGGFTGRANSALPLGDPGVPLDRALDHIVRFYQSRGLKPLVQVPLPLRAYLDAELDRRGWRSFNASKMLTAPISTLVELPDRSDLPEPVFDDTPTPQWLGGYRYRGSRLPDGAARVLALGDAPVFASVVLHGEVVAVGRGIVDEGWLGVTGVTVSGTHRRQGLGSYVMHALGRWGAGRGARSVYLQVADVNTTALAMYARLGMRRHHEYQYRTLAQR